MSKRKREIKKRKKVLADAQTGESFLATESVEDLEISEDTVPGETDPEEFLPSQTPIDDSQIVSTPAPPALKRRVPKRKAPGRPSKAIVTTDSWFGQNKENFLLGLLILYVLLLGLGTVGELFEIEWILNLPLFR